MRTLNPIAHLVGRTDLGALEEGACVHSLPEILTPGYPQAPVEDVDCGTGSCIFAAMSALNRRVRSVASPPFVWRSGAVRQSLRGVQGTQRVAGMVKGTGDGSPSVEWLPTVLRGPLAQAGGSFA